MATQDELFFLESPSFGKLFYHNVYSYYDEPLMFTSLNKFGQIFFCYSLGCDDQYENEKWIIVPTSESRVNRFEQKDISILDMIYKRTPGVYLTNIELSSGKINDEYKSIPSLKKLSFLMPGSEITISENINYDGSRQHTHRIRIAKKGNKLDSRQLAQASEYFNEFCSCFLRFFGVKANFFAQDAIPGSFVYRVKANIKEDKKDLGYTPLKTLKNKEDFINSISTRKMDLRLVRRLLDVVERNGIRIQLFDENSTDLLVELSPSFASEVIPTIDEQLGAYLDSTMVPQADSLERIKKYLSLVKNKQVVTSENLEVNYRQVSYYRDACKLLSLIHDYSVLTPAGIKAIESETEHEFISIIRSQFELSDCGFVWMKNQSVTTALELNETKAAEFLIQNCNGLSKGTSVRRSQTLKAWVLKFKEFA